jgi:hypothetical protein
MATKARASAPTKEKATKPSRIPAFRSVDEAAEFWDTHDSAEFEDEWEEVGENVRFAVTRPGEGILAFGLDEKALTLLADRARLEGVSVSALVRRWVLERIHAT